MEEFQIKRMIKCQEVSFTVKHSQGSEPGSNRLTFTPDNGIAAFTYYCDRVGGKEDWKEAAAGILDANIKSRPGFSGRDWTQGYTREEGSIMDVWDRL